MKKFHTISRCGIFRNSNFSHLMFLDGVLCAREAKISQWVSFYRILKNFGKDFELYINKYKTGLILDVGDSMEILKIATLFGVKICPMSKGFKYLGLFLKPCSYNKLDQESLVSKFKKILTHWGHKWLMLGGRVIMTKVILQGIPFFQIHLFYIPQSIIHKIESIISKFIWFGIDSCRNIHLSTLSMISRSIKLGGWGILYSRRFNLALLATNIWRVFNERGLWQK